MVEKQWTGEELLKKFALIIQWAFHEAEQHPELYPIVHELAGFDEKFLAAKFIWAGIRQSPKHAINGENGAINIIGGVMNRSAIYKFLTDLGFETEEKKDQLRMCESMEEVIALSPALSELAQIIDSLYEKHKLDIEQYQTARPLEKSFVKNTAAKTVGGKPHSRSS